MSRRIETVFCHPQFNKIGFSAVPVLGLLCPAERGAAITCSIGGYLAVTTANHPSRLEPLSMRLRESKVLRFGGKTPTNDFSVAAYN